MNTTPPTIDCFPFIEAEKVTIFDQTEVNLVAFRRTIYLAIQSRWVLYCVCVSALPECCFSVNKSKLGLLMPTEWEYAQIHGCFQQKWGSSRLFLWAQIKP